MACICIEIKERIEREKKKAYLKEEKMGNATVRVTREESWLAKCSERMEGNLRKGKRKLSQKDEKRKQEMEKF